MSNAEAMFSRRGVLFAGSATLLLSGLGACSARAVAATQASSSSSSEQASVTVVKPGAAWNGSAGSGGTPPVQAVRLNGRPACRWVVADRQRTATSMTFGVDADALGGVAKVMFWVEGAWYTVTSPSRVPFVDANGNSTTRFGYFLTLNTAACVSQSPKTPTNGTAGNVLNIYAVAYPNRSDFTTQTIGPLTIFPEATVNSVSKTIGAAGSGADYSTVFDALNATRTNGWSSPLFTFITSGYYDFANGQWSNYAGSNGYIVFAAKQGVTATIGRQTLDPTNTQIIPDVEYLEFRGSGVQLDTRNFTDIISRLATVTHRLNGCYVFTSEGTVYSNYWFNGYKKRGQYAGAAEDTVFHWQQTPISGMALAVNNKCYDYAELWSDSTLCAQGNWLEKSSADFFRVEKSAFGITYRGASATATVAKTGSNNSGTLVLKENGNAVATYTLPVDSTGAWYRVSDIVADINANHPGWTATATATVDARRSAYLMGEIINAPLLGDQNGFGDTSCKGVTVNLNTFIDIHTHGWQVFNSGTVENIMFRGNSQMQLSTGYTLMIFDSCPQFQDAVFTDFIFEAGGTGISIKTPCVMSHVVFRNGTCTTQGISHLLTTGSWNIDQYCVFEQCVLQGTFVNSGPYPTYPALVNCCLPTPLTRAHDTGNFSATAPFVDLVNHDLRLTGAPLSNLKAQLEAFDAAGNARAATDVIGALARGYGKPVWPLAA